MPVRMTEAWRLIDEAAIRRASGNPSGQVSLAMPRLRELEEVANPKSVLQDLLVDSSQFTGRRREKFKRDLANHVKRVADLISDFAQLRQLSAFRDFENDTRSAIRSLLGRG